MAERNEFQYDFWVLYDQENDDDERYAHTIVDHLEAEGRLKGFFDHRDGQAGQPILKNMEHAMVNSCYVFVLLSNSSIRDRWWEMQTHTSLLHQITANRQTLVPIYLPGFNMNNIPSSLSIYQGVNYDSANFLASLLRLFRHA